MIKNIKNALALVFIIVLIISSIPLFSLAANNECSVEYTAHVQDVGWQGKSANGELAGTEGRSLRLEALKINLVNAPENMKIKYKSYVQEVGWEEWKTDGEITGTEGEGLRLEAIQIELEGTEDYSVMYRVHIQDVGWQEWKTDGEIAGLAGKNKRVEAIQIKLVKKEKKVRLFIESNVNNETYYNDTAKISISGWRMANFSNNEIKAYIDGKEIASGNIENYARKDVISAIKDCGTEEQNPTPGFVVNVDIENLSEGKHTIKLNIVTSNQEIIETYTCTFNINRQLQVTYAAHVQDVGWQKEVTNGEMAGTQGRSLRLEALKINLVNAPENTKIKYEAYIQGKDWQEWKADGEIAGTEGEGLRLEKIKIKLENTEDYSVMYRVHIQDIGWQEWKADGEIAGVQNKRIEAIQIKLVKIEKKARLFIETSTNNNTYYKDTSSINISGWRMANFSNNEIKVYIDNKEIESENIESYARKDVISAIKDCGTEEQNPTPGFIVNIDLEDLLEGKHTVKLNVVTSKNEVIETYVTTFYIDRQIHVSYSGHVQNVGWQSNVRDGATAGTEGRGLRLEALKIKLINTPEEAKIKYKAYVEGSGWQEWKTDGEVAGTEGEGLRIEAIQIELENMENCTVEYKVHIQSKGWTDWYIDGETAGTIGENRRIEAIQIKIVDKFKREYKGIDVSKHNGEIDWQKVKNSGIEFAIIRCGYGQNIPEQDDQKFEYNVSECERLGIPYGVYLYSYALNTENASSEADHVLRLLNGRKPQLGIWYDIEDDEYYQKYGFPTNEMFVNIATTFLEKLKANGYYNVGIYANLTWLNDKLNDSRLDKYDKWVAQWGNECTYKKDYVMWQYTDKGQVDGISGNVDLDICYKKYF